MAESHTDELTENGILTDSPAVSRVDYVDLHGEPVAETAERVVFRDDHGYELNEWADALGVERSTLSEQMHALAREEYDVEGVGDPWSVADPVVFDARTFEEDDR